MALKGKLMAMSHLPVDEQLLAALGRVTIRHGFLDWTLNRTIKTLLGIKPEQADFAFAGEGSASLRRKILRIAAAKFQKRSDTYRQLAKIIKDCENATDQRNDLTHCVWVIVEGETSLLDLRSKTRTKLPTAGQLDALAERLHELAITLNGARSKNGFLIGALKALPKPSRSMSTPLQ